MQHFVERGPAEVGIHHDHALAALGEHGGEVAHGGGFAFARAGADDGDGVELVVLAGEKQVGAQDTVGFGVRAFRAFVQQVTDILRNDAQHRGLQGALDVVNGFDAGIQIFDEEGETNADHETDDDAEGDIQRLVGTDGPVADFGVFHDFNHQSGGHDALDRFLGGAEGEDFLEFFAAIQFRFGFVIGAGLFGDGNIIGPGFVELVFRIFGLRLLGFDLDFNALDDALDARVNVPLVSHRAVFRCGWTSGCWSP